MTDSDIQCGRQAYGYANIDVVLLGRLCLRFNSIPFLASNWQQSLARRPGGIWKAMREHLSQDLGGNVGVRSCAVNAAVSVKVHIYVSVECNGELEDMSIRAFSGVNNGGNQDIPQRCLGYQSESQRCTERCRS